MRHETGADLILDKGCRITPSPPRHAPCLPPPAPCRPPIPPYTRPAPVSATELPSAHYPSHLPNLPLLDQHGEPLCASPPPISPRRPTHVRTCRKRQANKRRPRGANRPARGAIGCRASGIPSPETQFQLLGLNPERGSSVLRENQRTGHAQGRGSYIPCVSVML